jgi:hypothetical protein
VPEAGVPYGRGAVNENFKKGRRGVESEDAGATMSSSLLPHKYFYIVMMEAHFLVNIYDYYDKCQAVLPKIRKKFEFFTNFSNFP